MLLRSLCVLGTVRDLTKAREWLDERLKSSVDKQMRQLWLDGIDALDDTPFLMGIVGNLYSAYGLVKPGNTASDEAQAHSDRLAEELVSFYTPTLGKPRLYTDPIPLASKAELAKRLPPLLRLGVVLILLMPPAARAAVPHARGPLARL